MSVPTVPAKTVVSGYIRNGWFGVSYNMNIYRGCPHGCIYCDSRSDCYGIDDFDTVRAKEAALSVIERDLKSKRKTGSIMTGSMNDPYNHFESECLLTRGALKLVDKYSFGINIITKSTLVTRDIDVLKSIMRHSPVAVNLTITTFDDELCKKLERFAPPSSERFLALEALADAGVPCGITLMPVLPFINDDDENVLSIVRRAAECGVKWIEAGFGVTLRQGQREYFYDRLRELFPGMRERYIAQYGDTYSCHSPRREQLWNSFSSECRRLGIACTHNEILEIIHSGYKDEQTALF